MTGLTPIRKSGRQRIPNRKYVETETAFQQMNEILAEEDSEVEVEGLQNEPVAEEDLEFSAEVTAQDLEQDSFELDILSNESEGTDIATPTEEPGLLRFHESEGFKVHRQNPPGKRSQYTASDLDARSRGLPEQHFKHSEDRIDLLAGPDTDEKAALTRTRAQWGTDPCLPRTERMRHAFAHTEEQRIMEGREGWDWYFNQGGRIVFAEEQSMTNLEIKTGTKYLMGSSQELLMGPYGNQMLYKVSHLQILPIDGFPVDSSTDVIEEHDVNQRKRRRHGWMLNVGDKVRCLDWAPNHNSGLQYLALASSELLDHAFEEPPRKAPAFSPCPDKPSSIQIWAFSVVDVPENTSTNSTSAAPKLKQVLCSDWGDVKQLKWCPMPREDGFEESTGVILIGLLAGVWGDGHTRILDVQMNDEARNSTVYLKINSAAFTARSADTICTCVCWLSPTDIAIGHSDGSITVYDIYRNLKENTATTLASTAPDAGIAPRVPHPYITIPDPRSTYSPVLTLTSGYPTHPTLLATSSISGYERLLDLRAPMTDYVLGPRTRSPPTNLVYSSHLLSFIYNEESDSTIRSSGLRCWGVDHTRFARTFKGGMDGGHGAGPLGRGCLDVGKVHSSVAWGGADGSVLIANPVKAVLGLKKDRIEYWQVCVCRLEWVRKGRLSTADASGPKPNEPRSAGTDIDVEMVDGRVDDVRAVGISRITQSYKAEKLEFVRGRTEKPSYATIYEDENAVTAVSWNPNLSCGGWVAVGWGCGLVRVEDVAI